MKMDSISKSDIDKIFGKILRKFRKKSGLTQEQLAEQLGISLKYISRIENGNNGIKTQTLIRYMNLLGIQPNTIYKDFITNSALKEDVELCEKVNSLSDWQKELISKIIDSLNDLDTSKN
jgi:transcriptional regulator with XRE-family HTH domain